jgi:hypothetical protein
VDGGGGHERTFSGYRVSDEKICQTVSENPDPTDADDGPCTNDGAPPPPWSDIGGPALTCSRPWQSVARAGGWMDGWMDGMGWDGDASHRTVGHEHDAGFPSFYTGAHSGDDDDHGKGRERGAIAECMHAWCDNPSLVRHATSSPPSHGRLRTVGQIGGGRRVKRTICTPSFRALRGGEGGGDFRVVGGYMYVHRYVCRGDPGERARGVIGQGGRMMKCEGRIHVGRDW